MTTTQVGTQGRYVEIVKPDNLLGVLKVESARWQVDGFFHKHEFRYILQAETLPTFIKHSEFVEHWLDGVLLGRFEWGHGVVEAYSSSQTWTEKQNKKHYYTQLISSRVLLHDLPCCGGKFVVEKSITDYFTLQKGHCDHCDSKWDVTDGHHFDRTNDDSE